MNDKKIKKLNITGIDVAQDDRIILDHEQLLDVIHFFKNEGLRIVFTMGAYDIKHVGHDRYLNKAKECGGKGAILVVGLDSDEYVKNEKGDNRPIVPFTERSEQLAYCRPVNIITVLNTKEEATKLMQDMRPHVVVLSYSSAKEDLSIYEERMKQKYGPYCDEVKIFERQAETSTTARIRLVIIDGSKEFLEVVKECTEKLSAATSNFFKKIGG
jgi:cytidyltransferase-like protein